MLDVIPSIHLKVLLHGKGAENRSSEAEGGLGVGGASKTGLITDDAGMALRAPSQSYPATCFCCNRLLVLTRRKNKQQPKHMINVK